MLRYFSSIEYKEDLTNLYISLTQLQYLISLNTYNYMKQPFTPFFLFPNTDY